MSRRKPFLVFTLVALHLVVLTLALPTDKTYDTIVVGLGTAGLTAVNKLSLQGKSVLGLEAADRLGGRVFTTNFGESIVEVGAEWIHGKDGSLNYNMAVENGITPGYQNRTIKVLTTDGRKFLDDTAMGELIFTCLDEKNLEEADKNQSYGEIFAKQCREYIKNNYPELSKDPEFVTNFIELLDKLYSSAEASNTWYEVSATDPYEDLDDMFTLSWGKHGYKTLIQILLNKYNNGTGLPNADILTNKEVTTIEWSKDPKEHVTVKCADGSVYKAKNVIVTVSLGVLKERWENLFVPPLPATKTKAIKDIAMGTVNKILLSFEQPWWTENTFNYFPLWTNADKASVSQEESWTKNVSGLSCSFASPNVIEAWVCGDTAKYTETLSEDTLKTHMMNLFRKFFKIAIPEPTGILRSKWFSNPFTRGSYSFDTVAVPDAREKLSLPLVDDDGHPKVLFAGEATNPKHHSTVHGAMETGVRESLRSVGKLDNKN